MNIWIFNQYALPPGEAGGTRHHAFAKRLIAAGHDVTLIASSFDHASRTQRGVPEGPSALQLHEGVPFLWIRSSAYAGNTVARLWNMIRFSRDAVREAKRKLRRPDVIVGSSPHLFAASEAEKLARRLGVPFVLEVRDLWPDSLVDVADVSPKHPLVLYLARLERRLYRHSQEIITLLPGARDRIVARGGTARKVTWIPNGVDLDMAPASIGAADNAVPVFIYAGAHGQANGLDLLLDAAHLLEKDGWRGRFVFRLIGNGPEKANLEHRAKELGLTSLKFEPAVPKAQVYQEIQLADACLMVLKDSPVFRWGVSPNKLYDYLVCGRPVIFAVSSPFDSVRDSGAGLSVPPKSKDLAEAVRKLVLMPPQERAALGRKGRDYVLANYDHSRLAEKFEAVLSSATKRV